MKVAGRWQSVFNPVEALSDCIDAEMQFHNLATLLPKDPMVEMSLEVTSSVSRHVKLQPLKLRNLSR